MSPLLSVQPEIWVSAASTRFAQKASLQTRATAMTVVLAPSVSVAGSMQTQQGGSGKARIAVARCAKMGPGRRNRVQATLLRNAKSVHLERKPMQLRGTELANACLISAE